MTASPTTTDAAPRTLTVTWQELGHTVTGHVYLVLIMQNMRVGALLDAGAPGGPARQHIVSGALSATGLALDPLSVPQKPMAQAVADAVTFDDIVAFAQTIDGKGDGQWGGLVDLRLARLIAGAHAAGPGPARNVALSLMAGGFDGTAAELTDVAKAVIA